MLTVAEGKQDDKQVGLLMAAEKVFKGIGIYKISGKIGYPSGHL